MARKGPDGLTDRQRAFVREYLVDLNAAAAFVRAGYKARTPHQASVNAARMMANDGIAAAVAAEQAKVALAAGVKAADVLRELALLGFSDVGRVLDFGGDSLKLRRPADIPEAARRCLASVKVRRFTEGRGDDAREVEATEFKLWDKVAALEKLGKHLGLFKDQLEVGARVRVEIAEEIVDASNRKPAPGSRSPDRPAAPGAGRVPPQ